MGIEWNEISSKSNGGTELLCRRFESSFEKDLLDNFQIIPTRVRELNADKIRILWIHDTVNDPECYNALSNNKWENFHLIVFVSHSQMQQFIVTYGIPWSKCCVIHNSIEPIEEHEKPTDKINLIYHTTPHRGLQILVPVFKKLYEEHSNIHLDVFSSFKIYGWEERDEPYKQLFEECKNHPGITYHGSVSNDQAREALKKSHIFAYPSIWPETSCLALIEAMSAKNICVHSNLGALYETANNLTHMYHFHEDINVHASIFYNILNDIIKNYNSLKDGATSGKMFADSFYNWNIKKIQWENILNNLASNIKDRSLPKEKFVYQR